MQTPRNPCHLEFRAVLFCFVFVFVCVCLCVWTTDEYQKAMHNICVAMYLHKLLRIQRVCVYVGLGDINDEIDAYAWHTKSYFRST